MYRVRQIWSGRYRQSRWCRRVIGHAIDFVRRYRSVVMHSLATLFYLSPGCLSYWLPLFLASSSLCEDLNSSYPHPAASLPLLPCSPCSVTHRNSSNWEERWSARASAKRRVRPVLTDASVNFWDWLEKATGGVALKSHRHNPQGPTTFLRLLSTTSDQHSYVRGRNIDSESEISRGWRKIRDMKHIHLGWWLGSWWNKHSGLFLCRVWPASPCQHSQPSNR